MTDNHHKHVVLERHRFKYILFLDSDTIIPDGPLCEPCLIESDPKINTPRPRETSKGYHKIGTTYSMNSTGWLENLYMAPVEKIKWIYFGIQQD